MQASFCTWSHIPFQSVLACSSPFAKFASPDERSGAFTKIMKPDRCTALQLCSMQRAALCSMQRAALDESLLSQARLARRMVRGPAPRATRANAFRDGEAEGFTRMLRNLLGKGLGLVTPWSRLAAVMLGVSVCARNLDGVLAPFIMLSQGASTGLRLHMCLRLRLSSSHRVAAICSRDACAVCLCDGAVAAACDGERLVIERSANARSCGCCQS